MNFDLSDPKAKVTISALMLCAIIASTWKARAYFEEFKNDLHSGQQELKAAIESSRREYIMRADTNAAAIVQLANGQVHFTALQLWAYQLERENRGIQRTDGKSGLIVPEPQKTR